VHWRIELPGTFDDYLRALSKRSRKSLRRSVRRGEQAFGDRLSIRRLTRPDQLEAMLNDMEEVARKTYQRSLEVGFKHDRETRATKRLALRKGRLSSYVAYVDGAPVAFDNAKRYGDTLYVESGGYDPAYASHGFGTLLLLKQIEAACQDPSIRRIDFGFGDSSYKATYSNESWNEQSIRIFAPTLKGVGLNFLQTTLSAIHHTLSSVLKRLGVFERVRKLLRGQQSRGKTPPPPALSDQSQDRGNQ
jgi:CelD/BcsL family acetyltransferase involved in cellulose biosynthesis